MEEGAFERSGETPLERTGRILGILSLFPLILLAIWLSSIAPDHIWRSGTTTLLASYGAVMLSFLGGVRWGSAISRPPGGGSRRDLLLAAVPAVIAWLSFAAPTPHVFAILAVAFAAQGASDAFAAHGGKAPDWYGRLRTMLTLVAVATLILAFAATV